MAKRCGLHALPLSVSPDPSSLLFPSFRSHNGREVKVLNRGIQNSPTFSYFCRLKPGGVDLVQRFSHFDRNKQHGLGEVLWDSRCRCWDWVVFCLFCFAVLHNFPFFTCVLVLCVAGSCCDCFAVPSTVLVCLAFGQARKEDLDGFSTTSGTKTSTLDLSLFGLEYRSFNNAPESTISSTRAFSRRLTKRTRHALFTHTHPQTAFLTTRFKIDIKRRAQMSMSSTRVELRAPNLPPFNNITQHPVLYTERRHTRTHTDLHSHATLVSVNRSLFQRGETFSSCIPYPRVAKLLFCLFLFCFFITHTLENPKTPPSLLLQSRLL